MDHHMCTFLQGACSELGIGLQTEKAQTDGTTTTCAVFYTMNDEEA
jgi:hypothetical protein